MENEIEIFVAWLIKYIKNDKRITGRELASRIKCDPTTISSYVRRRTKPDYKTRCAILDAVGVSHDLMLREGRIEIGDNVTATMPSMSRTDHATQTDPPNRRRSDIQNQKQKRHHQIIDAFHNHELAVAINQLLVEIEKMDGDRGLDKALDQVEALRDRIAKKKTQIVANGTEDK